MNWTSHPSMQAPDVCGEGQVICPCGEHVARFSHRLHAAIYETATIAIQRSTCPHCNRLIEVWRP